MRYVLLILAVFFSMSSFAAGADKDNTNTYSDFRLGAGLGIPYGYFGVNTEFAPMEYLSLTVGLGLNEAGGGWAAGVRAYPFGRGLLSGKISPRLSALWGTVAVLETGNDKKTDTGAVYGVGIDSRFSGRISYDFDLLYSTYDPPPGFVKKSGGDIKVSFGIGYHF